MNIIDNGTDILCLDSISISEDDKMCSLGEKTEATV